MFGLKEKDIQKIQSVFKMFNIQEAIIYGSRAMGNYKNGSDIDITLNSENLTIKDLFNIEIALDDLDLPYFFDVSIFQKIDNEDLINHIKKHGKTFYKHTLV